MSSCDVIALVHFWGGPAMAADGGFSMTLRFSVAREAGVPTLIGQSTLEAVGAVIDHQARTVRFRGATGPVARTARSRRAIWFFGPTNLAMSFTFLVRDAAC